MKKFLSILLVVMLVLSMIPATVSAATETVATFNLGANGSASHNDGNKVTTCTDTVEGYTLKITNGTNMYTGARDAKGNSCIKLGSSKNTGSFQFAVPANITSVIIYAAQYKANATKIKVNNTSYTLTKASNNGEYDTITVDTSATKTVTLTTVSGGVRAMVNTIEFCAETTVAGCEHQWGEGEVTKPATCLETGVRTYTCSLCSETKTEEIAALGHDYVGDVCTACGLERLKYMLVTDVAELTDGCKVVIVAADKDYALGELQNNNNRAQAKINRDGEFVTFDSDVEVITLGVANGKYTLLTNEGYLYAASSSSNYLKSQKTVSADAKWAIAITNGVASIVAQGSNSNNVMRYNETSSLFSCYGATNSQKNIQIYKEAKVAYQDDSENTYYTVKEALRQDVTVLKPIDNAEMPLDVTVNNIRYIGVETKIGEETYYTYYTLKMGLSNISLRSSEAGIYYSAKVIAPELLAALEREERNGKEVSYGVMLSLKGIPGVLEEGRYTSIPGIPVNDKIFTSGSVFGIFDKDLEAATNHTRAGKQIYANAYIKIGERIILANQNVGATKTEDDQNFAGVAWSFVEVLKAVDAKIPELTEKMGKPETSEKEKEKIRVQLTALDEFYDKWSKVGAFNKDWGLENMKNLQVPIA